MPRPARRPSAATLALAAFTALAGCGPEPAPAPAPAAAPALWRITDADTTIYLFGTVHLLPPDLDWQDARVERAIAASDALLLEVADPGDAAGQAAAFRAAARAAPGAPPLTARVPTALRDDLAALLADGGPALARGDALKTWAAALLIGARQWRGTGATASAGADTVLATRFRAMGRPVAGLETQAEQFAMFDALPGPAQRDLLAAAVREARGDGAGYADLLAAWSAGDAARVAALVARDMPGSIAGPLLADRNARWAAKIAQRMEQPGTVLVAVGAAHLAGSRSVQVELARRGHVARPL